MAALKWDEQAHAYTETHNVPMRHDSDSGAWVETTGMAWDEESQAWTERWGAVSIEAYVYGAALETVTIKKDGIIVATVNTDSTGQSTEQITLSSGTYTLTGSVSGWTEEQAIDKDTTKFRAMPNDALYWYGNICKNIEFYKHGNTQSFSLKSVEKLDVTNCSVLSIDASVPTNGNMVDVGIWDGDKSNATIKLSKGCRFAADGVSVNRKVETVDISDVTGEYYAIIEIFNSPVYSSTTCNGIFDANNIVMNFTWMGNYKTNMIIYTIVLN